MGSLTWIIFGALAGLVASMIAGTSHKMGWPEHVLVGIVGAGIGGVLYNVLTGQRNYMAFNLGSFIVAVLGSLVLLVLLRLVRRA